MSQRIPYHNQACGNIKCGHSAEMHGTDRKTGKFSCYAGGGCRCKKFVFKEEYYQMAHEVSERRMAAARANSWGSIG